MRSLPLLLLCLGAACGDSTSPARDASPDSALDAPFGSDAFPGNDGSADASHPDAAPEDAGPSDSGPDATADASAGDADTMQLGCDADVDLGTATGVDVVVDTLTGSENNLEPECAPPVSFASPERIFLWQAPWAGTWTFDTLDSSFDTVLHVRSDTCRLRGCSDDFLYHTVFSRVTQELDAGETLFLVVEGWGSQAGDFHLSITELPDAETDCVGGLDEDRDDLVDCVDPDCQDVPACLELDCADGEDNDGDGRADCADSDCAAHAPCSEEFCADGLDNDNDLSVDCADSDCGDVEPCVERVCDDGIDVDMNGLTDCEEPACACAAACLPPDPCPEVDLGSATGVAIATGVTEGCPRHTPDPTACPGDVGLEAGTGPEATFLWTAPEAGTYIFDTSGSRYDTTLYLLDGCAGELIVCNEDIVTVLVPRSRVAATFAAGESVIVVVDGWGGDSGSYVLTILPST